VTAAREPFRGIPINVVHALRAARILLAHGFGARQDRKPHRHDCADYDPVCWYVQDDSPIHQPTNEDHTTNKVESERHLIHSYLSTIPTENGNEASLIIDVHRLS
jgi:hypothetical protein